MSNIVKPKTKIYYCSDIHQEFADIDLTQFQVKGDVLLLCGDICNIVTLLQQNDNYTKYNESSNLIDFFDLITNNFKHVIYVMGNHEFYLYGDINKSVKQLKQALKRYNNLNIVNDGELVEIDNNAFIVGTCWTDFNNEDPITLLNAPRMIADYRQIMINDKFVTTTDILKKHKRFVKFVESIDKVKYDNVILVTHHAPTFKGVQSCYKNERIMNGLFNSNLDNLLSSFDYAFHGHQHQSTRYEVNDCKLSINARCYPTELGHYTFELKSIEI